MSWIGKIAAVCVIAFCSVVYGSERGAVQFGGIRIKVSMEATPATLRSAGSSGVYASGGAVFKNSRWLVVLVSFQPGVAPVRNVASARSTGNTRGIHPASLWLDDVTMRVTVAFPSENARRSNVVYGLFEGETRFWSVRLDAKRRNVQMFIPPQLLDRYIALSSSSGKEVSLGPSDYRVLVEFFDRNGKVLGRSCESINSLKGNNAFAFFEKVRNFPGATIVPGAVLPRSKTPWAWHQFSTFDYVKDVGEGSTSSTTAAKQ